MKYAVKPYAVIGRTDWTVDSLFQANYATQTPAGVKLSDVVEFNRNRLNVTSLDDDSSYPYIEATSISAENGVIVEPKLVTKSDLPTRAKYVAHAGDVLLMTVRPERGLVAIVPKELDGCLVSSALVVLSPIKWNSELIYFLLRSEKCRNELSLLARGRAVPALTLKQVTEYTLPLSSVTTELLSEAAELYRAWAEKIQNQLTLAEITEGVFRQRLLVHDEQIGVLPKYKIISYESLIDRLDVPYYLSMGNQSAEWRAPVVKLSDIITTTRAGQSIPSSRYTEDGIPFIRIQDLDNDSIYLETGDTALVPEGKYKKAELIAGDLLIARVGSVGKTNVVSKSMTGAIASQHLLIMKTVTDVLPEYVTLFLKSKWGKAQFDALSVGVAQPFIQQSALEQILLPVPPLKEQETIVESVNEQLKSGDTSQLRKKMDDFNITLMKV